MAGKPKSTPVERAFRRARRLLAAGDKSEGVLRERLSKAGFEVGDVEAALAMLRERRLIDDARLGARVMERGREAGHGAARINAALANKGLAERVDERVDAAEAVRVAREIAAATPEGWGYARRARKVLGALARRGFGEEDAMAAVEVVLGPAPDEGS